MCPNMISRIFFAGPEHLRSLRCNHGTVIDGLAKLTLYTAPHQSEPMVAPIANSPPTPSPHSPTPSDPSPSHPHKSHPIPSHPTPSQQPPLPTSSPNLYTSSSIQPISIHPSPTFALGCPTTHHLHTRHPNQLVPDSFARGFFGMDPANEEGDACVIEVGV